MMVDHAIIRIVNPRARIVDGESLDGMSTNLRSRFQAAHGNRPTILRNEVEGAKNARGRMLLGMEHLLSMTAADPTFRRLLGKVERETMYTREIEGQRAGRLAISTARIGA
jgi:hypothetical protein